MPESSLETLDMTGWKQLPITRQRHGEFTSFCGVYSGWWTRGYTEDSSACPSNIWLRACSLYKLHTIKAAINCNCAHMHMVAAQVRYLLG